MKYFRMSYEEIVFKRSYVNIILLNRSIPSYNFDRDDSGEEDRSSKPKQRLHTTSKGKNYANEAELFMSLM